MTDQMPPTRGPILAPFLLGLAGAVLVLLILLNGLVWTPTPPNPATVSRYLALPFAVAFAWSGVVLLAIPKAGRGVPAAGFASVWALLGLGLLVPTGDPRYVAFVFVSFICLLLGRLGERAARWVFPERFGS